MKLREILLEIDNKKIKELEKVNRSTLPKIPTNNIFFNDVKIPPVSDTKEAYTYLESGDYTKLPTENINVRDIIPTQRNVNIDNLKSVKNIGNKTDAFLFKYNDKFYVLDGHHRISINILNGETVINAFVFDATN